MPKNAIIAYTNTNEESENDFHLGGAFLLILALVASVCLLTLPAQAAENNEFNNPGVVRADTEVIDGHEYTVLNIYQDTTQAAVINFLNQNNYAKLVVQEDLLYTPSWTGNAAATEILWNTSSGDGHWVILDLHGHTISFQSGVTRLSLIGEHIELWDSSPAGTGRLQGGHIRPYTRSVSLYVAVYGGTFNEILPAINNPTANSTIQCEIFGGVVNYLHTETNTNGKIFSARIYGGTVSNVDSRIAVSSMIGGVTYETIYLSGNHDANVEIINAHNNDTTKNYRYVLTADWDSRWKTGNKYATATIRGKRVIFDLNGHTYYANGWEQINGQARFSYLVPYCDSFELTDSSVSQTGRMAGNWFHLHLGGVKTVVISGGSGFVGMVATGSVADVDIIFEGGNYDSINYNEWVPKQAFVAPYLRATYDADGRVTSVKTYDYYAVSITPLVSGVYNYAYGYQWEINVTALKKLAVPADKTYYLWARNDDDAWYHYLDVHSVNGAWNAA